VDEEALDRRRIIRRGIPYGAPFDPTSPAGGPDEERGLVFICYQADLVDQFEFMQRNWVNTPNFPPGRTPKPGPDPMIGGALSKIGDGDVSFETDSGSTRPTITTLHFQPFVHTEGSLYAFTPSLTTLRKLGEGRLDAAETTGGHTHGRHKPQPHIKPGPIDEILPWADVEGRYWISSGNTVRVAGTDARDVDQLTTGNDDTTGIVFGEPENLSAWDALRGVERVDAIWPVPDEQRLNGESSYWLFHTVNGTQYYRRIWIALNSRHTSRTSGRDMPLTNWRTALGTGTPVTHVDAVLPVPDMQHVNGRSQYWLFHTTPQGQRYRLVSITENPHHTDRLDRDDRDLTPWKSLNGITHIDALTFVLGKYQVNGTTWCWVQHDSGQYRTISIADGPGHHDTPIGNHHSRPNTPWFRPN
jgi:hypothetical protein